MCFSYFLFYFVAFVAIAITYKCVYEHALLFYFCCCGANKCVAITHFCLACNHLAATATSRHTHTQGGTARSLQWSLVHLRAPTVLFFRSFWYFMWQWLSFISLFSTSATWHAIHGTNGACCKQITFSNMCHSVRARVCVCVLCQIRWELQNREQNFKIFLCVYIHLCVCVSVCCKSICSQRNLCVPA